MLPRDVIGAAQYRRKATARLRSLTVARVQRLQELSRRIAQGAVGRLADRLVLPGERFFLDLLRTSVWACNVQPNAPCAHMLMHSAKRKRLAPFATAQGKTEL